MKPNPTALIIVCALIALGGLINGVAMRSNYQRGYEKGVQDAKPKVGVSPFILNYNVQVEQGVPLYHDKEGRHLAYDGVHPTNLSKGTYWFFRTNYNDLPETERILKDLNMK
jgi:hypothetical protein